MHIIVIRIYSKRGKHLVKDVFLPDLRWHCTLRPELRYLKTRLHIALETASYCCVTSHQLSDVPLENKDHEVVFTAQGRDFSMSVY